jgi:hypothetical protein
MLATELLFVYAYCLIDDAIKAGVPAIPRRPGPAPACTDAELLTIALVRHLLGRRRVPVRRVMSWPPRNRGGGHPEARQRRWPAIPRPVRRLRCHPRLAATRLPRRLPSPSARRATRGRP